MTGKGQISVLPNRRLRLMLVAHCVWFVTICLLGAWWGRLLMRQAAHIEELEGRLGLSASDAHAHWARTQHMLAWESSTFFVFVLLATGVVFWLYWHEARRARGIQAFFASVTHELRTPLTSIRLQAESIADQLTSSAPDARQAEKLVQRLLEDTTRLESQVERTLELARVEGGGGVLSQSLLLKPWLEYFLRNWNESHGGRLAIETRVGDCLIQADPGAVQVILKNLLDNTLRHSGRAGRELGVELSSEARDGWLLVRYRDNGTGYQGDPGKLGRLFEKGAGSPGAGVGLYLVSALMNRMGGRVEFAATPQLQTTLWFRQSSERGMTHG